MDKRTEGDILAETPVVVRLGERDFAIKPQKYGRSKAFRDGFGNMLDRVKNLDLALLQTALLDDDTVVDLKDLVPTFLQLLPLLAHGVDEAIGLIYVYSPEIEDGWAYIEEHADDGQCLAALMAIFGLVYRPFVRAFPWGLATKTEPKTETETDQANGSDNTPTPPSSNDVCANGVSAGETSGATGQTNR
jgi:hypothetical protein